MKIVRNYPILRITFLQADGRHLTEGDRQALLKLIEAAKLVDDIFLAQVWEGNEGLRKKLEEEARDKGPSLEALRVRQWIHCLKT